MLIADLIPYNRKIIPRRMFNSGVNRPYNMQIEFVEGCNRRCDFCGGYSIWGKNTKKTFTFMDVNLAEKLSANIGVWLCGKRIEFAMHGEPLLHPDVYKLISIFRSNTPKSQLQLTTNGDKIVSGEVSIDKLFERGLNVLVIDTYGNRSHLDFVNLVSDKKNILFYDYYKDNFNPYHYHSNKIKVIVFMSDLGQLNNVRKARKILNHAGNVNFDLVRKYGVYPLKNPLKKKCSRVFREMTVHADGTVPICCIDWRHEFIIGDTNFENLEDIWAKAIWNEVRQALYAKDRGFTPCSRCDYNGGFRIGFLNPVKDNYDIEVIRSYKWK